MKYTETYTEAAFRVTNKPLKRSFLLKRMKRKKKMYHFLLKTFRVRKNMSVVLLLELFVVNDRISIERMHVF